MVIIEKDGIRYRVVEIIKEDDKEDVAGKLQEFIEQRDEILEPEVPEILQPIIDEKVLDLELEITLLTEQLQ